MNDSEKRKSFFDTLQCWYHALNGPAAFVATMIALLGAYFAAVDLRVKSIVGDPQFKAEIARLVRPAVVFDSEGRIHPDTGALALLESVPDVRPAPEGEESYHTVVTIRTKAWMAAEPILESLDTEGVSVKARPIKGNGWEIRLSARRSVIVPREQPTDVAPPRYRLELIPP